MGNELNIRRIRRVLRLHFIECKTQKDIGLTLSISGCRVGQLINKGVRNASRVCDYSYGNVKKTSPLSDRLNLLRAYDESQVKNNKGDELDLRNLTRVMIDKPVAPEKLLSKDEHKKSLRHKRERDAIERKRVEKIKKEEKEDVKRESKITEQRLKLSRQRSEITSLRNKIRNKKQELEKLKFESLSGIELRDHALKTLMNSDDDWLITHEVNRESQVSAYIRGHKFALKGE